MNVAKANFLLPLKNNDGRDLGAEITEVRIRLTDQFKGWTLEGTVEGVYEMAGGAMVSDRCAKYMVFLDESRIEEIEHILLEFKKKTLQETIYLEIQHNVDIRFV